MNFELVEACSDLGVHVDGTNLGPTKLCKNINIKKNIISKNNIKKSKDINDLRKNEKDINDFTQKIYNTCLNIFNKGNTPFTIGGDHSIVIGSILASQNYNKNIGVIWIDAHGDFNTFETTKTGNIHGLPFAAVCGYKCKELTNFITSNYVNPKSCVVVGARSIDPWEIGNLKDAGVTIFTTEDLKKYGVKEIMNKAFEIASSNTNGIHISYDLDVIDPIYAPGVSVPEENGITELEAYEIMNEIINNNNIKSIDLVEFNPLLDKENKTYNIATNLINKLINKK